VAAFYLVFAAWVLTVLEGFVWERALNALEHACYAASALVMAAWCWKVFERGEEAS